MPQTKEKKTNRQMNNNNKTGVENIHWEENKKKWTYSKMINGKIHKKRFPYFIQAVIYKKEYEAKNS